MATKERAIDRGHRQADRQLGTVGSELHEARLAAGVSQTALAQAAGTSRAEISRIERGRAPQVPLRRLTSTAAVLGMGLSVRLFPAGLPLRDEAQRALLERLRSLLPPDVVWRTEVPIPIRGDLRAWDASISGSAWTVYVDAETRLRDIQALQRRTMLKQRDTSASRVILLIADTRKNRSILAVLAAPLFADAIPGGTLLAELVAGRDPGGSGVIVLRRGRLTPSLTGSEGPTGARSRVPPGLLCPGPAA